MAEQRTEYAVRIQWVDPEWDGPLFIEYDDNGLYYMKETALSELPNWKPGANAVVVERTITVSDWEPVAECGSSRADG